MKRFISAHSRLARSIEKLPKIYLVGFWAHYGVQEYYFSGKCAKDGEPLVWQYDDFNGTADYYVLRKITSTTSGAVFAWTINKKKAEYIATKMEEASSWRGLKE